MNPSLAIAMVVAGGALLALAVLGYVLGWFGLDAAITLGVSAALIDTAGALLLVTGRRRGANAPRR
jgi:sulfite exporter TauE/SafE